MITKLSLRDRFLLRCKLDASGCWLWTGATTGPGYGKTTGVDAHRAAYTIFKGAIPKGKYVLHRCDIKLCVNPDHLWAGTQKENVLDAKAKGMLRGGRKAQKFCLRGHAMEDPNIYYSKTRGRRARLCKSCSGVRTKKHQLKKSVKLESNCQV